MMRTGSIRDAQYARVLSAAHRRYAPTRWMRLMRYAKFPSTVKGAVPLNLVLPRVALLEPLLGNLVNVWHLPLQCICDHASWGVLRQPDGSIGMQDQ